MDDEYPDHPMDIIIPWILSPHAIRYLVIDQLLIPVMIENYRSGQLWNFFMLEPEIQTGLGKLGFE